MNVLGRRSVLADMSRDAPVRAAILRGFCGRLADRMLKAAGLPKMTAAEKLSGRLCYTPITQEKESL